MKKLWVQIEISEYHENFSVLICLFAFVFFGF